jgi:hypothetical protein
MVAFRTYVDSTQQNTKTDKSYEDFCRTAPSRSVNHTDFQPLKATPIVLSIETKPGSNSDVAELQMGVWHAAQWAILRSSILRAQDAACSTEQQNKQADQALSRLRCIPTVLCRAIDGSSFSQHAKAKRQYCGRNTSLTVLLQWRKHIKLWRD